MVDIWGIVIIRSHSLISMNISLVWLEVVRSVVWHPQFSSGNTAGRGLGVRVRETDTPGYSYKVCSHRLLHLGARASVCRDLGQWSLTRTSDEDWWLPPDGEKRGPNEHGQRQGKRAHGKGQSSCVGRAWLGIVIAPCQGPEPCHFEFKQGWPGRVKVGALHTSIHHGDLIYHLNFILGNVTSWLCRIINLSTLQHEI